MSSVNRIRVLTVDDHPILRDGIAAILECEPDLELVGEASNGEEAVSAYRQLKPDVVLMDIQMPVMDGIHATKLIRNEFANAHIVVLTTYAGDASAVAALQAGATSYLLKSAMRRELIDVIRSAHSGRRFIRPEVAGEIAAHYADEPLTKRELEILRLVANGRSNKEIAFEISVSDDTVKAHLKSVFAKLDVSDRTHAVTTAMRRGFIAL